MELNQLTIKQAHEGLKKKEFSSVDLTRACLDQIKKVDAKIKSFISVTENQALAVAKTVDQKADFSNPLAGIPVGIKDIYCTKGIKTTAASKILENYDKDNITIGVLGGHSALDVCRGAKKYGFRTLAVCQKGRELTYSKYYKSQMKKGVVDEVIVLDRFSDITRQDVQKKLVENNTIFVHNRYFWVYCNFRDIESTKTILGVSDRFPPCDDLPG